MIVQKDERIQDVTNIRVNLDRDNDLFSPPSFSAYVDSGRFDLANINQMKDYRTHVFLRGNVRLLFDLFLYLI